MTVEIQTYRAAVGHFYNIWCSYASGTIGLHGNGVLKLGGLVTYLNPKFILFLLILLSGDVHSNPGPSKNSFSICHLNAQSLYLKSDTNPCRKLDEIHSVLCVDLKFDVICISETWLDGDVEDSKLDIPEYTCHRRDRADLGGGVAIFVSDHIPCTRLSPYEPPTAELMWLELTIGVKKIIIGCCYRPPGQNAYDISTFMDELQDSTDIVLRENPESIYLLGDFNDRCVVWDSDHRNSELKSKLFDWVTQNDLHQVINEPTHIGSTYANLLDLLITDSPAYVVSSGTLPPIGSSHCVVYASTKFNSHRDKCFTRKIWKYNECNYEDLNDALTHAPWQVGESFDDIDDMQQHFCNLLLQVVEDYIPHYDIMVRPRDKPWMTGEAKHSIRCCNRLFRRFKRSRRPEHELAWKASRRLRNYSINKAKLNYFVKLRQMLADPQIDAKKYWRLVKLVYGSKKQNVIPSLSHNNMSFTTSIEKAELFNDYFASQQRPVVIPDDHQLPPIVFKTDSRLDFVNTTPDEVYKVLKVLKIAKASGPDGISNRMLKETATSICRPLASLFNQSFSSGKCPTLWKIANVSPVFKKSDRSMVANYRPVSLLPCIAKVQEKIVFNILYKYLVENNLLTWRNSGFKKGDSAVNQLLHITDRIYQSLENGADVCAVFLDISKAFDRVWHEGLLHKLRCLGIGGSLFDWLSSYLYERKQRVIINGQCSSWTRTYSGVPQGSILGPLLFLVFINDIVENMESDTFLFADDTSLLEEITNIQTSFLKINRDLERLSVWAHQWLVQFNEKKTVYMVISRKRNPIQHPDLFLNTTALQEVSEHCQLGLNINRKFSWDSHIKKLTEKASKSVNLLKRICRDVPRRCLENVYKTMIRPIMEYGDIIFDGERVCHTRPLEHVQRQAALCCTGAYKHTRHVDLLRELGWETLSDRRRYHRLRTMFNIMNGAAPEYLTPPPSVADTCPYRLRNRANIVQPRVRSEQYKRSFFPQTTTDWNNLELQIRDKPSLASFSRSVKPAASHIPWFSHGMGRAATNQTRIRLGLSALNAHRKSYNFINYTTCSCGWELEDSKHYLLFCPLYTAARTVMLTGLDSLLSPHLNTDFLQLGSPADIDRVVELLTSGNSVLSLLVNEGIFDIVQRYITSTHRF